MRLVRKAMIIGVSLLPWRFKRRFLIWFFGWELHPKSYIGLSFVDVKKVRLAANASIGNFCVFKGLDVLHMAESASIGRMNFFTCIPTDNQVHYKHIVSRSTALEMGVDSAITSRHYFDCNEKISIGKFSTFAGGRSQILTHSIDVVQNIQDAKPVKIGDYCFVGTSVVILGGSNLPDFSVLGACSMLNKPFDESHSLYAGVPAMRLKSLPVDAKYFSRKTGFVK